MKDTKALERKEHLTQRNLEIKQKNAKNKIRSKSCIEKTFSPTMKQVKQLNAYAGAVE